jgi:hypothetical protein
MRSRLFGISLLSLLLGLIICSFSVGEAVTGTMFLVALGGLGFVLILMHRGVVINSLMTAALFIVGGVLAMLAGAPMFYGHAVYPLVGYVEISSWTATNAMFLPAVLVTIAAAFLGRPIRRLINDPDVT